MNQAPGSCLSPAQAEAARRVYQGLKDPRTGGQLYPGLAPGSEPFWPNRDPATPFPIPIAHYKWLVFADPDWDWRTFAFTDPADYEAHVKAEAKLSPILNATDPNLRAFQKRGGKLIQYHGWVDQLISPQNSIDYYESVLGFFGGKDNPRQAAREVQSFYRLFMAPGMAHCGGGPGPNTFDMQAALEQWVSTERRPTGSLPPVHSMASSIARVPCVRIRSSLSIRVRETRTTRQVSFVGHPDAAVGRNFPWCAARQTSRGLSCSPLDGGQHDAACPSGLLPNRHRSRIPGYRD
jgi:hypothetical protein